MPDSLVPESLQILLLNSSAWISFVVKIARGQKYLAGLPNYGNNQDNYLKKS